MMSSIIHESWLGEVVAGWNCVRKLNSFEEHYLAWLIITVRRWNFCVRTGFDLTFQKWFVNFPNKNNHKTDLKCWLSYFGQEKKLFYSILPTFLSNWKTVDLHFMPGDCYNMRNSIEEPFENSFGNTLNQIMLD